MSVQSLNRSPATDYDVVVIGGALAGASAALLLKRWLPAARILVIERQERFNRKVGEATVEISSLFLHRVLGLYDHLAREQLPKHGLRYWFNDDAKRTLAEMSEVGGRNTPRFMSFQLDRAKLDERVLADAHVAGCELARPAKVGAVDLGWPHSQVAFSDAVGEHTVSTRWVIDASGRQAFIARRLKLQQPVDIHPTASVWARFRGVADMDGPEVMGADIRASRLPPVFASRRLATNHFCGYGCWCWVIPLGGGETSIGVVYNKQLFDLPDGDKPRERLRRFVATAPGLRELTARATMDDDDFHALGSLPYTTSRYMDRGWALVGDAASFIDPYYSPGLDHLAMSVYASVSLIEQDLLGRLDEAALGARIAAHNASFLRSIPRWIGALYQDKYELMGDAELLRCAFLFDTSLYFMGVVGPVYRAIDNLRNPPFGPDLPQVTVAYRCMRFFNRRMVALARFRRQAGLYGRRNNAWRAFSPPFNIGVGGLRNLSGALWLWLKLEVEYGVYRLRKGPVSVAQPVAAPPIDQDERPHTAPL